MKLLKKLSVIAVATTLAFGACFGAGSMTQTADASAAKAPVSGKVVINGSSAMLPLLLQASKEFKQKNPKVTISVSGSSSIVGPQSVAKGVATIGSVDWDASKKVPGFDAFAGQVGHKIAVIPFATIVNKNVQVDNLTTQQLQDIFSGKVTNWKQVGGHDADIIVINRAHGSGSRVNYQVNALKSSEFMKPGTSKNYKEVSSNGVMVTSVQTTPNSIGYTDLVYVKGDIKALKYNGVEASVENVVKGTYPVIGYGYLMTKGAASGADKAFIDYVLSKEFQQGSLKKMKFIPAAAVK